MIQIKINKQPVTIPAYSELTCREYKELTPFIAKAGYMDALRYICVTTGADYQKSLHFKLNNVDRLNSVLGTFKFVAGNVDQAKGLEYVESSKPRLIFKHDGFLYDLREQKLDAVGYRIVLEQFINTKANYMELYIFMLALVINSQRKDKDLAFDYDSVFEVYMELSEANAFDVLTTGSFFFYRWKRKESSESLGLRLRRKVVSILTRPKRLRLVLIDSRNIQPLTK